MINIIIETIVDSLKLLPFLFITYLVMEYIEHKAGERTNNIVKKSGKLGPVVGSVLGAFPQCGFSVASANLYAARVISLGTIIAVFLSTSDEMIPVLISSGVSATKIFKILLIKIIIAFIAGTLIDLFIRIKNKGKKENINIGSEHIHDMCEHNHCNCEEGIFKSSIKHTINIFGFILLISFVINCLLAYVGEDSLSNIFMSGSIVTPFIAGILGLIPNCASSVLLTQLYLSNALTFGATMAGLLVSSGLGIAVLFKVNKNIKENLWIVVGIYSIGVLAGILLDIFKVVV